MNKTATTTEAAKKARRELDARIIDKLQGKASIRARLLWEGLWHEDYKTTDTANSLGLKQVRSALRRLQANGTIEQPTRGRYCLRVRRPRTAIDDREAALVADILAASNDPLASSKREFGLAVEEMADRWVPANGGTETPFIKEGRWVLYCFNPKQDRHAYYDCATDVIIEGQPLAPITPTPVSLAPQATTEPQIHRDADVDYWTTRAMMEIGGSFVQALGKLFTRADAVNYDKLRRAFAGYWEQYEVMGRDMKSGACSKDESDLRG